MGPGRLFEPRYFNDVLDDKLIAFVRTHPVLYQSNNRDIRSREQAWHEISSNIGRSVLECKTRWRTIRDTYKKKKDKRETQPLVTFELPSAPTIYNNGCLNFLDGIFRDKGSRTSRFLQGYKERHSREGDDFSNEDQSILRSNQNTEIKIEMVTGHAFSRENEESCYEVETRGKGSTPASPEPRVNGTIAQDSGSHVSVHEIESETEETENGVRSSRLTNSSEKSISDNRTELSSEMVSHSGAGKRKRALNSGNRMTPKDAKRRRGGRNVVFGELPLRETNSLPAVQSADNASEHPIQTFFRSMATTVMSFPPRLMAETRLEICKIVTEAELRCLAEQNAASFEPQTHCFLTDASGNPFPTIVKLANPSQSR